MQKLIIKGEHGLFWNYSAEGELEVLEKYPPDVQFYYVCIHGIRRLVAQRVLLRDHPDLARLQEFVNRTLWHAELWDELIERGIRADDRESDEKSQKDCLDWLFHCWKVSPNKHYKSEAEYGEDNAQLMAGVVKPTPTLTEAEQLVLLESNDRAKIREYGKKFKGRARTLFVRTAPVEELFRYFKLFDLEQNEIDEYELFQRGDSYLTWHYVFLYDISAASRKLLKNCGNPHIFKCAVMRHYSYMYEFEHKFGSIANWVKKLEENFDKKYFPKQK